MELKEIVSFVLQIINKGFTNNKSCDEVVSSIEKFRDYLKETDLLTNEIDNYIEKTLAFVEYSFEKLENDNKNVESGTSSYSSCGSSEVSRSCGTSVVSNSCGTSRGMTRSAC